MNDQQKLKQLERLDRVTDQEWREVRLALARRLAWRLKAVILTGEHGELILVGGKTRKGAHSEANLSMPPLSRDGGQAPVPRVKIKKLRFYSLISLDGWGKGGIDKNGCAKAA